MNSPVCSIIIPTYNSAKTLDRALKSILIQSFSDYEVLIMDGISTDETLDIANGFRDNRIRVFSEADSGIYDAMNKAIDLAKGEWLYFLGSDDELFDRHVFQKIFSDPNIPRFDVIYGQVLLTITNRTYDGVFNGDKLIFRNISHQAILTRRIVFERLGKFDLKYKICADHIFNIKWFFDPAISKKYIDLVIAKFDQTGVSSMNEDPDKIRDLPLAVRTYGGNINYYRYFVVRPGLKAVKRLLVNSGNRIYKWFRMYFGPWGR